MNYSYAAPEHTARRQYSPLNVSPVDVANRIVVRNGYFDGCSSIVEAVLDHVPSLRNSTTDYAAAFISAVHASLQDQQPQRYA